MSARSAVRELDLEALAAAVAEFLDRAPVAEGVGARLSRLLQGFLELEVLPQADAIT